MNYQSASHKFNCILYWNANLYASESDFYDFLDEHKEALSKEDTLDTNLLIDLSIEFAKSQDIETKHSYTTNGIIVLFFYPEEIEYSQEQCDRTAKDA
jgi:hypothetical protein